MCETGVFPCSPRSAIHHERYVRVTEGCEAARPLWPGSPLHSSGSKRCSYWGSGYLRQCCSASWESDCSVRLCWTMCMPREGVMRIWSYFSINISHRTHICPSDKKPHANVWAAAASSTCLRFCSCTDVNYCQRVHQRLRDNGLKSLPSAYGSC